MHFALAIWLLVAVWLWADWKNWERYYSTLLYMACMGVLYLFFAEQFFYLWKFQPDFLLNQPGVASLHTFWINPMIAFLFLSHYPTDHRRKLIHYLKWFIIFILIEWLAHQYGRITYQNGWNLGWSVFFDLIMLPMLRLHYTHKLWALAVSFFWILFFLFLFGYPVF